MDEYIGKIENGNISEQNAARGGHQYAGILATGQATLHLGDLHYHIQKIQQHDETTFEDRYGLLCQALTFERMDARLLNIPTALPRTCQWIFDLATYEAWQDDSMLDSHHGFLWIKGKPGSGKSTIMKQFVNRAKHLSSEDLVVSYFFNARAPGQLEKSAFGLYRSLTHQILSGCPQLHKTFVDRFWSKSQKGGINHWTEVELQEFIIDVIRSAHASPMQILIDALDEGDEADARKLVDFLEDLGRHAIESGLRLRICLSSRHYPQITLTKGLTIVLEDQPHHDTDISEYVRSKLKGPQGEEKQRFHDALCSKAGGIFLWVVLVVSMLNQAFDQGDGLSAMMRHLDGIPEGLNGLFARILNHKQSDSKDHILLFQWVLFATRRLSLVELYCAMKVDIEVYGTSYSNIPNRDTLTRWLLHKSRGLLELTKSAQPVVQFIHETVREFLIRSQDLSKLVADVVVNFEGHSHDTLKTFCSSLIQNEKWWPDITRYPGVEAYENALASMQAASPFLQYAVENLFIHADYALAYGVSQNSFIKSIMLADSEALTRWLRYRNALQRFMVQQYSPTVSLWYILAEQRAKTLLEAVLQNHFCDINQLEERYGTALQAACVIGDEDLATLLIRAGADINLRGGEHYYPILAAAYHRHVSMVSLLIQNGAQISSHYYEFRSALEAATELNDYEMVAALGQTPVQSDCSRALIFKQPLKHAIKLGMSSHNQQQRNTLVELLMDLGAEPDADIIGYAAGLGQFDALGLFQRRRVDLVPVLLDPTTHWKARCNLLKFFRENRINTKLLSKEQAYNILVGVTEDAATKYIETCILICEDFKDDSRFCAWSTTCKWYREGTNLFIATANERATPQYRLLLTRFKQELRANLMSPNVQIGTTEIVPAESHHNQGQHITAAKRNGQIGTTEIVPADPPHNQRQYITAAKRVSTKFLPWKVFGSKRKRRSDMS